MIRCVSSKITTSKEKIVKFLEEIPKIDGVVDYFYLF